MPAVYPAAVATTTDLPDAGANLSSPAHSTMHNENRDEIIAIETELGVAPSGSSATVAARFQTLWEKIGAASFSAASSVDITIPASTYLMVRITVWGFTASGVQELRARVNNDSTAGLHRYTNMNASNDAVATASNNAAINWRIGDLNDVQSGIAELTICEAHQSSRLPSFSKSAVFNSAEASASHILMNGSLTANRTLSSLRILPAASTITGFYHAEGVRL